MQNELTAVDEIKLEIEGIEEQKGKLGHFRSSDMILRYHAREAEGMMKRAKKQLALGVLEKSTSFNLMMMLAKLNTYNRDVLPKLLEEMHNFYSWME